MKESQSIIVYGIILFIASCSMPEIEIPEYNLIIEPETIEDIPVIEEKKIMIIKPIKEYEKYSVLKSGQVYGLKGNKKELISLTDSDDKVLSFNDFFTDNGDVYFQIKEILVDNTDPEKPISEEVIHYFCQVDKEVSEFVSAKDYPTKKESSRVEMGISPWSIINKEYKGEPISSISQAISIQNNPVKNFLCIDGYFVNLVGIWFSVSIGMKNIESGLWYSALNSGRFQRVGEYGRIW